MTGRPALSWPQVLAWRLRRQRLDPRGGGDPVAVVRRLCGVQAQVASAAALAVAVRQAEPDAGALDQALAQRRLLKTWAMRGTLHLLPPAEAGAYLSLLAAARPWERPSWQRAFGAGPAELAAIADAAAEALDGRVLSRAELAAEIVARTGRPALRAQLESGWGALLKPLAWQGRLCQGPAAGNRVSFVRPDTWYPDWGGVPDPDQAARTVIPAYLGVYGPATPARFDQWLTRGTSRRAQLRGWFDGLGEQLATVEVDGEPAYALAADVEELSATRPSAVVRLLPGFDQYLLGPGTGDAQVVDPARRPLVSRAAGWISPVVVAAGRVVGTWQLDGDTLAVRLFDQAGALPGGSLEAEAAHLGAALGRELTLAVAGA